MDKGFAKNSVPYLAEYNAGAGKRSSGQPISDQVLCIER